MANVELFGKDGKKMGDLALPAIIAETKINPSVVHQAVVRELANARLGTAATKTRGMVSGGGAKPHKQKGTGRARAGSNRSPIWTGGGTIFGPQPRSYTQKLNRKMRQLALKSALADKADNGELKAVERFELKEAKTKEIAALLKTMEISGSLLIVVPELTEQMVLATRNLKKVKLVSVSALNTYDVIKYNELLITKDALELFGGENA